MRGRTFFKELRTLVMHLGPGARLGNALTRATDNPYEELLLRQMIEHPEALGFGDSTHSTSLLSELRNSEELRNALEDVKQDPFEELRNALEEQYVDALRKALEESITDAATNTTAFDEALNDVNVEAVTQLAMACPITGAGSWPTDISFNAEVSDFGDFGNVSDGVRETVYTGLEMLG